MIEAITCDRKEVHLTALSDIRMVVTDLDGTFLPDDKTIRPEMLDMIRDLKARDIFFAIATARPYRSIREGFPDLLYDAAIFHNGALLMKDGQILASHTLENASDIVSAIQKDHPGLEISVETMDENYCNFDPTGLWPDVRYQRVDTFDHLKDMPFDKIILRADSLQTMEEYKAYLRPDMYAELSEHQVAMIMHRDATKAKALKSLAQAFAISEKEIVAFGDDYNDISMLLSSGIGVAVDNALEDVKRAADEITCSNEEAGVVQWVRKNLLGGAHDPV